MKKTFLSFLLLAALLSCNAPKETTEAIPKAFGTAAEKTEVATPQAIDSLLTYIERTACYGKCPMYKFSIYNSGYALYEGKNFVDNIGKFEARFSANILEEIKANAKSINYFDFKDEYPKTASDFPSVKTAVVLDGKRKSINNGSGAPPALKSFEKYLDSLKDSVDWKKVH